jgi:RNA polymerase sigma factor for flagellar operon FliA
MDPQAAFLSNLETIERIVAVLCRRHLLQGDERDDFDSYVKFRLIENDYATFAKFQGRSSLSTYLMAVIARFYLDFRTKRWGRWRPSAEAKRLGELALQLEILIHRDGHSRHEAIQILRSRNNALPPDAELIRLANQLPGHQRRHEPAAIDPDDHPSAGGADEKLQQEELERVRAVTLQELGRALSSLPAEDALIMRMCFLEGMKLSEVARTLQLEQKPLYRRVDGNLKRLQVLLEQRGVTREQVAELLA